MASRKIDVFVVGASKPHDVNEEKNIYIVYEKSKGRASNTVVEKLKENGDKNLPAERKVAFIGETEGKLATIVPVKVDGVFKAGKSVDVVKRLVAEGLIEDNLAGNVLKEIADKMGI